MVTRSREPTQSQRPCYSHKSAFEVKPNKTQLESSLTVLSKVQSAQEVLLMTEADRLGYLTIHSYPRPIKLCYVNFILLASKLIGLLQYQTIISLNFTFENDRGKKKTFHYNNEYK